MLIFKGILDFTPFLQSTAAANSSSSSPVKKDFQCSFCSKSFKGLVWLNNHQKSRHPDYLSAAINQAEANGSLPVKFRCNFPGCSKYYANLESKSYKKHVSNFHSNSEHIQLLGNSFFDDSIIDFDTLDDQIVVPHWLKNISDMVNKEKFNFIHLNINSILGASKFAGLSRLLV